MPDDLQLKALEAVLQDVEHGINLNNAEERNHLQKAETARKIADKLMSVREKILTELSKLQPTKEKK